MSIREVKTGWTASRARGKTLAGQLNRAYIILSLLLSLALSGILFTGLVKADSVITGYGLGFYGPDGTTATSFSQVVSDSPIHPPDVADQARYEMRLLHLVNAARADRGLPPLKHEPGLAAAARGFTWAMTKGDFFASQAPDGSLPPARAETAGYAAPTLVVENLAAGYGSPEEVIAAWLADPRFAANLLNPGVREAGGGYTFEGDDSFGPYVHYWAMELGQRANVYPVVINQEAESTSNPQVELYLYGAGWATQMRVSNQADGAEAEWQPFAERVGWNLTPGDGPKTVYVWLQGADGTVVQAEDSIALVGYQPPALVGDVMRAPARPAGVRPAAVSAAAVPGYYETSGYLLGKVAVGLVLPESNGTVDASTENWSGSQEQAVYDEIVAAANWWATRVGGRASFMFEMQKRVSTGYEPIHRPQSDEGLWIGEVMAQLGYSAGDYFERVYAYNNALRLRQGADWALTIFVVNSQQDDGYFADGRFAYAYLNGPFMVLTYKNGGYGIENMDAVAAHEMGHSFGALDQYAGAGLGCSEKSGYLGVENQNSDAGCASNMSSIMRGGIAPYTAGAVDMYALGQIGYRDTSGQGIPDPLNTVPQVELVAHEPDPTGEEQPVYTGTAWDVPYPAVMGSPATINRISGVDYRVDGGDWQAATAVDGAFDSAYEGFSFVPVLGNGAHVIEVRARNTVGKVSAVASDNLMVEGMVPTATPQPTQTPSPTPTPVPTQAPSPTPSPTTGQTPLSSPLPPTATPTGGVSGVVVLQMGWNLVALPVAANYTAESMGQEINAQGGQVTEIDRWYAGGWNAHLVGYPFNNFALELGKGYFVKATQASTWTVVGEAVARPVAVQLTTGWNLVAVPKASVGYTAESMGQGIAAQGGEVTEIDRWYAGGWNAHLVGYPFNNFAIEAGKGYFVKAIRASTWTPQ